VIRVNLLHPQPSLFLCALLLSLWWFSVLENYYFQVSSNLKVIFHVTKITRNTATLLLYGNPSHDIFRSLPSSEILGGSKNSQSQDVKVPHVDFTRIFILHEIIHATHMVIGLSAGGLDTISNPKFERDPLENKAD